VGGLFVATMATLFVLPATFGVFMRHAAARSASLDPDDPQSAHWSRESSL
jgi:hypothetical protein